MTQIWKPHGHTCGYTSLPPFAAGQWCANLRVEADGEFPLAEIPGQMESLGSEVEDLADFGAGAFSVGTDGPMSAQLSFCAVFFDLFDVSALDALASVSA